MACETSSGCVESYDD